MSNINEGWGSSFTPSVPADISPELAQRLMKANLPVNADGVLMLWQQQQAALAAIKEDEIELRKVVVKLKVTQPKEGMNNVDLGGGFTLKAGIKVNYNLDDNEKVEAALDQIEAIGNEGSFIASRLVKWTADLSITEYRKLCEDAKTSSDKQKMLDILNTVLTTTDGTPSLEIKEPKKPKA